MKLMEELEKTLLDQIEKLNDDSLADVTRAETEATRREFPYLHRRDNLVK